MNLRRWIWAIIVVAALVIYAVDTLSPARYSKLNSLREDYRRISALNSSLREENQSLKKQIESLDENGILVEVIARNELGMIKEGEKVFVIENQ